MKKIVFDVETKNIFEDVGKNDPTLLDISVVGVYNSETDAYVSFVEEEFGELWRALERTEVIIGFNSNHFDIPLLNKYYPGDLRKIKSVDLLQEIKTVIGRRVGLNNVARATLGYGKSGHGLDAYTWWKQGEIEKIRRYCLEDVRLTKELYDFMKERGLFKYRDGENIFEKKINTEKWEAGGAGILNQTLGF